MRSDAIRLSSEDYDYIMQYKDAKSKPLDMLRDKYPMSNTRFYQIWKGKEVCTNTWNSSLANPGNDIPISVVAGEKKKRKSKSKSTCISDQPLINKDLDAVTSSLCETEKIGRISETKKETTPPVTSQKTEDVLELHKRNQKDIEKIRASGRTLVSKLSVP
ncbi:8531_t:CDS:1 [Entrophospora sp. SA101]|nr:8531_t:CDS:1 [Entrophospora sp. SA101]CAJ0831444.1 2426_t:CDS:1 [Entrophospora sp. SA101]